MAVTQLPDGRWICYYRVRDPEGKSRIKKEYFGRGIEAEASARKRDSEVGLEKKYQPTPRGYTFGDLALAYAKAKNFSPNSLYHLNIRLNANILPFFQHRIALKLTDQDLDRYIQKRRRSVKDSTIRRESL